MPLTRGGSGLFLTDSAHCAPAKYTPEGVTKRGIAFRGQRLAYSVAGSGWYGVRATMVFVAGSVSVLWWVERSDHPTMSDSASALHIYCFLLPTKCLYLWHL